MNTKHLFAIVLILCGLAAMPLQAQNTIKGRVLDAGTDEPVPFATVAVMTADSAVVGGTVADDNGSFAITVADGSMLAFSSVGYHTACRSLKGLSNPVEVKLEPTATLLEAVQVTAKKPIIEQQMDKLVMNVAQSAFAQGNNAMDLLRKAPGVSIDKDGNVKLNGQPVSVWIDGRPSQLDGKSLEALLRSTDGTSIDKIEVIANPSAKYDAAGQGGIIDIRTKRNFRQGFNGSLSASGGMMGFGRNMEMMASENSLFFDQDVSLNLNYRTSKTNTFLQISEGTNQMGVDVVSETDMRPSGIDFYQKSVSRYDAHVNSAALKLGNDWFIDKRNTLGIIFTVPMNSMTQWADTSENRSFQRIGDAVTQQIMTDAVTDYRFTQYMGNLNYTHVFDESKMSEITANLDYMHNVNRSSNPLDNYYLLPSPALAWLGYSIDSANRTSLYSDNIFDVYSVKADWQGIVMKMFMMEAGAKWALSKTANQMEHTVQSLFPAAGPASTFTDFDYTEHIGALYATLAGQLAPLTVKIGLRGEYTYAYNSTATVTQNYFNLFPTAYIGYNSADMMKRYGISYTRRIQRPNYAQLNPFQNYIDAHTSNMGNPDLRPAFSDNLNLTAGFGQYVTIAGTFVNIKDNISHTPIIDPATGDQVLRADNIGSNRLLGGSVTLSELPLGKHLTLMLNASLYDFRTSAPAEASLIAGLPASGQPYEVHSLYSADYACLTLILPQDWKVQLDGYLSTPVTQGYLRVGWSYAANVAVKKSALDGRLLFSLSVNDLFRTMSNDFVIYSGGVLVSSYAQQYLIQKVSVGLQWNFGQAQKPLKHRNVGTLDEASRTGGNNALGGQSER